MTMPDPLEPLHRALAQIRRFGLQEQFLFHRLQDLPEDLARETLGEVGALFSHFEDLRRTNEEALKHEITRGEEELRKEIDHSLGLLLKGLEQFRNSINPPPPTR
jgi:hypothetical protein